MIAIDPATLQVTRTLTPSPVDVSWCVNPAHLHVTPDGRTLVLALPDQGRLFFDLASGAETGTTVIAPLAPLAPLAALERASRVRPWVAHAPRALEAALLLGLGVAATAPTPFVKLPFRIPGHHVLLSLPPLCLGVALVPRRLAATTTSAGALAAALLLRFGGAIAAALLFRSVEEAPPCDSRPPDMGPRRSET